MNIEMNEGPSIKDQLLVTLTSFLELLLARQQQAEEKDSHNTHLGLFIADLVNRRAFINFEPCFSAFQGLGACPIPSAKQVLHEFGDDDESLFALTSIGSSTIRSLRENCSQFEIRALRSNRFGRNVTLLTWWLSRNFLGTASLLQLAVVDGKTPMLEMAFGAGIEPILDMHGATFMCDNNRLMAASFPTSIAVQASASVDGIARLTTAYSYAGRKRETHTQLLPQSEYEQPRPE